MRLIDADELLDRMKTIENFSNQKGMFAVVRKMIENAPTVDAVPIEDYKSMERTVNKLTKAIAEDTIMHGHWIFNPKDAIEMMFTLPKCSECGAESSDGGNYCTNCGAKMDEVKVNNSKGIDLWMTKEQFNSLYEMDEVRNEQ